MIAVDTNVVLRLVLGDDQAQLQKVRELMLAGDLFVPLTVLLESGWVLESRYGMARAEVATILDMLLTLEGIVVARRSLTRWAIERYRRGADWADVVHLAAAAKVGTFATFDRRLARDAGEQTPVAIELLA